MKTQEEIRYICGDIIDSESVNTQYKQAVFEGIVLGYTHCQEDMAKSIEDIWVKTNMKDNIFSKKEFWLNYYDLMTDWEKENSKIRVVEDAFMCGYDSRQNEINELKKQIESLTKDANNQCTCFGRYICDNCNKG